MGSRFGILALAAMLALPAASATWRGYGTHEPDSFWDSTDFMRFNASTSGAPIYFNAWSEEDFSANPNLGTLGTRNDITGERTYTAMLGAWVDCNQDGFVGLAEDASEEYPSALLTSDQAGTICPDGGPHNGGGWVTELLWLGYDYSDGTRTNSQKDPRSIMDPAAIVWGDEGLWSAPKILGAGVCPTTPVPRGTFQSTGGVLNDADCTDNYGLGHHWNNLMRGEAQDFGPVHVPALPALDGTGGQSLILPDPTNWKSNPNLDRKTFGSECASNDPNPNADNCAKGDQAIVHVSDCQADPVNKPASDAGYAALESNRPDAAKSPGTARTEYNAVENDTFAPDTRTNVYAVKVSQPNPPQPKADTPGEWDGGDVPATVNMTNEERPHAGRCDYTNDGGQDFYGTLDEGNNEIQASRNKVAPDHQFNFSIAHRGETPIVSPGAAIRDQIPLGTIPASQPSCLGVVVVTRDLCFSSQWTANDVFVNPIVPRAQLITFDAIPHRRIASFYAHVSASDGDLPGGNGVYGASQCRTIGPGAQPANGWNCDPSAWYKNADGTTVNPIGPRPQLGATYQLRDVDCWDGQVATGVPLFVGGGTTGATCDEP